MARIDLNISLIQDGTMKVFVSYLDELRQDHSDNSICQSLFEAVVHESMPPNIFGTFLSWSKSPSAIASCIRHGPSRSVRRVGIEQFGKAMTDPERWESAWREIGGRKGLIDIFAEISVVEAKALSRAIGRCNSGKGTLSAREKAIEELLHTLLPSQYSTSDYQSYDKRPITHHYALMVPACSPEFVGKLLDAKDLSNPLYAALPASRLRKTHQDLLQQRVFEGIFGDGRLDQHVDQYIETFVYSLRSMPGPDLEDSAPMRFATKILQLRLQCIDNNKSWPTTVSEVSILYSLLGRSLRRRLPETKLHSVFALGLHLLEVLPKLEPAFRSKQFWSKLISRWRRAPELYEDLVALALRLRLSGYGTTIGKAFLTTSQDLENPGLRWLLLRLYCLNVPKKGVDLDLADDFSPLAMQSWPSEVFYQLSKEQAVRLLKGLMIVNPNYSFLQSSELSILNTQEIPSQKNFNVGLLLTILQREDKEIQSKAQGAVDELRKKAATAREPSHRACFAQAASDYAIASGNYDLYRETVVWHQRYVRDHLTLQTIFGENAVMTKEGIDLLSGIPQALPEDMTLAEVALRVEKANQILRVYHETLHIARQEPSFHESDWDSVTSLFGAAIEHRVACAKNLQKRRHRLEMDVYTAIWSSTFAMLQEVSADFIDEAYEPVKKLLGTLPPTALAATTKAMLDAANEKRKKQGRHRGDDMLEQLSYEVLLRLAESEKPELAQQFVLQTILDRPDASSWHRQLLSASFIKTLNAKDARQMLLAFANSIVEKLEEQSHVRVGEGQASESTQSSSLIKVTTVKYLAQLLDNAEFISLEVAIEVLLRLFKAATHIDIRLATLESLLSMLNNMCSGKEEKWKSNASVKEIMQALEMLIPIVGSIYERCPLQQDDWEEARKMGTLPDISNTSDGWPPLLKVLVTQPQHASGLKRLHSEFVARLFLPILRRSEVEHRRWITLFLAKHYANVSVEDLPVTPITRELWLALMESYSNFVPREVLEDFNKYTVMTIAPPANLKEFNNTLRENSDICHTPEVQHWLSIFDRGLNLYHNSGTKVLMDMINQRLPHVEISNGINFDRVLEMVIAQASLILADYENYIDVWDSFVYDLRPPTKSTFPYEDAESISSKASMWQKTGRIVIEQVIVMMSDTKKKQFLEDIQSVLPSTMTLRLWLLPYPCSSNSAEVDEQCKLFAKEMEDQLGAFLEGSNNILLWHKIAKHASAACKVLNTDDERLRVALHIGKLKESSGRVRDQTSSALNLIRITLAMKLIQDAQKVLMNTDKPTMSVDFVQDLRKRVKEWETDSNEVIREKLADWRQEHKTLWKVLMISDE